MPLDKLSVEVTSAVNDDFWAAAYALVARAPSVADVLAHRLGLLAAAARRAQGLPVPQAFVAQEQLAAVTVVTARALLRRIRAVCDGPLVIVKGPELAAHYPQDTLRVYGDLDLLAPDAPCLHRALAAAGFDEVNDEARRVPPYHLTRLRAPELPLIVEVHGRPNWPLCLPAPPEDVFFERLEPSATGVTGIETLPRERHALVVAAHAWAHAPLTTLRDLIDIGALIDGLDRSEIQGLADEWRIDRIWRTTLRALDSVVLGSRTPGTAQRLWARHLASTRERTVFESHLEDLLSGFSALPPVTAVLAMLRELARDSTPSPGETWSTKVRRTRLAFQHAFSPKSRHDRALESEER
jgi:hypothetical protein